jgi:hypothetical protein
MVKFRASKDLIRAVRGGLKEKVKEILDQDVNQYNHIITCLEERYS